MKIPNFNLKEEKNQEGKVTTKQNAELLLDIFHVAISDKYSETKSSAQGEQVISTLSGSQGRMWGRIQRKLDEVIEKKTKEVKFEESEIDFLKGAIEVTKFPVSWFRWIVIIQDELEAK